MKLLMGLLTACFTVGCSDCGASSDSVDGADSADNYRGTGTMAADSLFCRSDRWPDFDRSDPDPEPAELPPEPVAPLSDGEALPEIRPGVVHPGADYPQAGLDAGEHHQFRLSLLAGSRVEISTHSAEPDCDAADTVLEVTDQDDIVHAANDDTPLSDSRCSSVSVELPPGEYRVSVSAFGDAASSSYTLRVFQHRG